MSPPALRFRSYALGLALLTGLGLFFLGDVREVTAWALLAFATALAFIVPPRLLRPSGESPDDFDEPTAREPSSDLPHFARRDSEPVAHVGQTPGPDDVDYLRALRHEFRTPLNAVLGFSDVLLRGIDGEVNESQREDLEIIRASGIRLRVLLDSALDITQLAEGELRLDVERVDMCDLVGRAASEAGQLWSSKRELHSALPEAPCLADADEARLRRSILVLADFLATSHRDADIAVRLTPSDDHCAIEVTAETTERQSLEALPTTAEVLAAEDATTIRQWPVAVTSELIGRHGGSLYHGSAPARFMIRLPVGDAA